LQIKTLDLGSNNIGDKGMFSLIKALNKVKRLRLLNCGISHQATEAMAKSLIQSNHKVSCSCYMCIKT